ncbi:hypothetical protein ACMD2_08763 [Ananas comosus]|uniref:Uncharacterized protein n=2 Tax=Ananas comosus TaxID=4615 RepID=A0A199VB66_ANACO|nr:hypothetical protein ACMD2_08763 [Ananas comosus]CAD1819361.1 unnamed protein product [Ananas comosus var. bracteatus]
MGACLSSSSGTEIISDDLIDHSATAKVITVDGHLLEYSAAVKAYEVLGLSHPFCFLCSSDDLDCDAPIPPLGSQDSLERGQLYFMLPVESLRGPLRGRDMAALAVRASLALAEKRLAREPGVARVLPIGEADGGVIEDDVFEGSDRFHATSAQHLEKEKMIRRKEMMGREKFMGWPHSRARLGTIRELAE